MAFIIISPFCCVKMCLTLSGFISRSVRPSLLSWNHFVGRWVSTCRWTTSPWVWIVIVLSICVPRQTRFSEPGTLWINLKYHNHGMSIIRDSYKTRYNLDQPKTTYLWNEYHERLFQQDDLNQVQYRST